MQIIEMQAFSPLYIAYSNNDLVAADIALQASCSIDQIIYSGFTLIEKSAEDGDYKWFSFAKEHLAKSNILLDKDALLSICIENYNDLDHYCSRSPNLIAKKQGYIDIALDLVHSNPNILSHLDVDGHTYLENASQAHDLSLYNALVSEYSSIEHN